MNPGHSRVYFEISQKLAAAEFELASKNMDCLVKDISHRQIKGINYICFSADKEMTPLDIITVSGLSFIYALFEIKEADSLTVLIPIERSCNGFVDESMSSMLKYQGKTNEIFTRMLINTAYYSQKNNENIRLLDPVAGKGTTLFEGLIKGFNVCGIEISDKVVSESYHFVKKFLETAKYKFETDTIKMSGANKSYTALKHSFSIAKTKEDAKAKKIKSLELICASSQFADFICKKASFDLIVGDLPYGIQHSNVTNENQSSATRNPLELLTLCLPSWVTLLKKGGALALSWNVNVLERKKMTAVLENSGLKVLNEGVYLKFEHRVDQAIIRDIIVAIK